MTDETWTVGRRIRCRNLIVTLTKFIGTRKDAHSEMWEARTLDGVHVSLTRQPHDELLPEPSSTDTDG